MAEYVEREKVRDMLHDEMDSWGYCADEIDALLHANDKLYEIPAADVAPVVRCKDCKHYGGVAFGNVCRRWSAPLAGMKNCTKPDDFCSYAERRETDAEARE